MKNRHMVHHEDFVQEAVEEEGWSRDEKLDFISKVYYISILLTLCSGGSIFLSWKLGTNFYTIPSLCFFVMSIVLLIYGGIV